MNEKRIWFFGDSFCANESNWVKQLSEKTGSKIGNLGLGGASLDHTLETILSNVNSIKKNDTVIVCFTSSKRHYFKGRNLRLHQLISPEEDFVTWDKNKEHYVPVPSVVQNAYREFETHLYTEHLEDLKHNIVLNHIINDILPNLKTKNVVYFSSMEDFPEEYTFFRHSQSIICKPFWHIAIDFLGAKYGTKVMENWEEFNKILLMETTKDNHFLDDPEYKTYWWKELSPVLNLIGIQEN